MDCIQSTFIQCVQAERSLVQTSCRTKPPNTAYRSVMVCYMNNECNIHSPSRVHRHNACYAERPHRTAQQIIAHSTDVRRRARNQGTMGFRPTDATPMTLLTRITVHQRGSRVTCMLKKQEKQCINDEARLETTAYRYTEPIRVYKVHSSQGRKPVLQE